MPIVDYTGSPKADKVNRKDLNSGSDWARYYGKEGDDEITWNNGEVFGGLGNDTIIRPDGETGHVYVVYWDAPAAIYADLGAGYVLDGWGTRDTLVNINQLTGSGKNDTIYGSNSEDTFSINWGKVFLDGRGGYDVVNMEGPASLWRIKTSEDGRITWVTNIAKPNERVFELHNVERLNFGNTNNEFLIVKDLIDRSQIGPKTLIESNTLRWNASGALGSAANLTYSFTDTVPQYGYGTSGTGSSAWTVEQKNAVRAAFAIVATETQLSFQEVTDSAGNFGQIRLGINQQSGTKAYSFLPDTSLGSLAGDIWLSDATAATLAKGNPSWQTLLREIGHALGLKQPLSQASTGSAIVLLDDQNDSRYTVMSQNDVMNGIVRDDFGMHDVTALRYLYGTRSIQSGDNIYNFTDAAGLKQQVIVDDGGLNTIDVSKVTLGARIDLRPGYLSSIGRDLEDFGVIDNVGIATSTKITSVIGTEFDDLIVGNDLNNIFIGLGGNDQVDGGVGEDIFQLTGGIASYDIYISEFSGNILVSSRDGLSGIDSLKNIERLKFSDDMNINLGIVAASKLVSKADLQSLAELYVAFFNRIPDADGMVYWLGQIAAGQSLIKVSESFYKAAIQFSDLTGYSATMSNDDFVKIIYKNVLGRTGNNAPPESDVKYWSGELQNGNASKGSLVSTMLNAAHRFKGDATWGWVPDLLDNKILVANYFAIQHGLNYNSSEASISNGMAIAAAVTANDISLAIKLIGISDTGFSLL